MYLTDEEQKGFKPESILLDIDGDRLRIATYEQKAQGGFEKYFVLWQLSGSISNPTWDRVAELRDAGALVTFLALYARDR